MTKIDMTLTGEDFTSPNVLVERVYGEPLAISVKELDKRISSGKIQTAQVGKIEYAVETTADDGGHAVYIWPRSTGLDGRQDGWYMHAIEVKYLAPVLLELAKKLDDGTRT